MRFRSPRRKRALRALDRQLHRYVAARRVRSARHRAGRSWHCRWWRTVTNTCAA